MLASSASSSQTATAVWVDLCGSIPMMVVIAPPGWLIRNREGTPDFDRDAKFLFRATRGEVASGRSSCVSQPTDADRQALSERTRHGPLNATNQPQRLPQVSTWHL